MAHMNYCINKGRYSKMRKKLLRRALAVCLAVTLLAPMTVLSGASGFTPLTASALEVEPQTIDSGSCGNDVNYILNDANVLTISGWGSMGNYFFSKENYEYCDRIQHIVFADGYDVTGIGVGTFEGLTELKDVTLPRTVTVIDADAFKNCTALTTVTGSCSELEIYDSAFSGDEALKTLTLTGSGGLTIHGDAFRNTGLKAVTIASENVFLHPDAFKFCSGLETMSFTAYDGTTIEGMLDGLPETAAVTVTPFSKIHHPATKRFSGPSVAYDYYQPEYDHAVLYWDFAQAESILQDAQESSEGVRISDVKESLEWLTNDNISSVFPNAHGSVVGTMQGNGSAADPLEIWDAANWRYLDFLGRIGKLNSSYYGWDRGTNVKLMADLTLSDKDGTFTTIGGDKHKEVHNSGYAYVGNFDGNGHTITLDVNESIDDGVNGFGLIEKTDGAYIKNLNISGRMVSSQQYTGLLVGYTSNDYIINCSSDATLVLSGSGEMKSGALVGYAYKPTIENCHFTGRILGGGEITAVGGFVGELSSSNGGVVLRNCYFAPSQIDVSSEKSCILYRPYYGSYSGWCGFETLENNFYNAEALKLSGADMGDLDQGTSDSDGIASLNETEFWDNGVLTMPRGTVEANPGTRNFVYTGDEHRIFMDLQDDAYHYASSDCINRGDSFPYMPGYALGGIAYYKVNDGEWSSTPPLATEVGEYTVYYRTAGDAYHRDSDTKSIKVTISEPQELPGSGTQADPYTISNDLEWSIFCDMRDTYGKYFRLVDDIVVSEDRQSKRGPNHPLEFNGCFDGDGHRITFYYVSRGTSDSLFGKVIGKWSYDTSSYSPVFIKNLTVDGVMYGGAGENSPIAYEITHNATVSNVISNMTIVHLGAGKDTSVAGIVNTGSLSGGVHFYNCKVGGRFSASGGDKTFAGLAFMNDFWQSGNDFIIRDCYVDPTCEDIKVSSGNYVILKNHAEGKSAIENTYFGQSILGIIPIDEETGETTNTQGISDENGLGGLYATGYWADGNPTMPEATLTPAERYRTISYKEPPAPETDPETGEEIPVEATVYTLIDEVPCQGGTVWYSVNGGEWSTDVPTTTEPGKYDISYKAVGDILHRDSEEYTSTVSVIYDWATPTGLTVDLMKLPVEGRGELKSGENAPILVQWDDHEGLEKCAFTLEVVTADGRRGSYFESAPVGCEAWHEHGTERPGARFFVGLLGKDDEQTIENGMINGAKYGDSIVVTATGFVQINGASLESVPCGGVDLNMAVTNVGASFPEDPQAMTNDSFIQSDPVVLGDKVYLECLASGGKAPYKFEVTYKKLTDPSYSKVQSYKSNRFVYITPARAAAYTVHVNAKDAEGNIASKDFEFTVNKPLANLSAISDSEIVTGDTVTVNASSEGGVQPGEYKVTYQKSGSDTVTTLQDYSDNDTVTFTPSETGSYLLTVSVKDRRDIVSNKSFELKVSEVLTNLSTLSEELIVLGDTVTINADSTGGILPVEYEFSFKSPDSGVFKSLATYGTVQTVSFTPVSYGEYTIRVRARDSRGTVKTKNLTLTVNDVLKNDSQLAEDMIILGSEATVNAAAFGGIEPYEYEVRYKRTTNKTYTVAQAYAPDSTIKFKPTGATAYDVRVSVRDSKGTVVRKDFVLTVRKPLENTSSLASDIIVLGGDAVVNCKALYGAEGYEFEVSQRKQGESYELVKAFGTYDTAAFRPETTGVYEILVKARDAMGNAAEKTLALTVNPVLANSSELSSAAVQLGRSVTVSCKSEGGIDPKQYKTELKADSSTKWTTVQDYTADTEVSVTPSAAGTYKLRVTVKDSTGKTAAKEMSLEAYPELINTSALTPEKMQAGRTVTINCSSGGGYGTVLYSVSCYSPVNDKWTRKTAYSAETTVKLTLSEPVDHIIRVSCKDEAGNVVAKDMTISVYEPLKNTSSVSKTVAMAGSPVKVSFASEGGLGTKRYSVISQNKSTGKWAQLTEELTDSSVNITINTAGEYLVRVKCTDEAGVISRADSELIVYPALKNTSTVSPTLIQAGKSVTVSCKSDGGYGTKTYAVWYYNKSTKKWYQKSDYSTEQTVEVTLKNAVDYTIRNAVDYTIRVNCKDEDGNIVKKDMDVTVYKSLKNTSTVASDSIRLGYSATVNANSTGGCGTVRYLVQYKNNADGKWITVQDYSTNKKVTFKPAKEGKHTVRVIAKDGAGNTVTWDHTITVFKTL